MSTLLDGHDVSGMMGLDVPDQDQDEVLVGGLPDEEQLQHAGTGGSSKIKSRPGMRGF